jgi:hypothetical protein
MYTAMSWEVTEGRTERAIDLLQLIASAHGIDKRRG